MYIHDCAASSVFFKHGIALYFYVFTYIYTDKKY